MASQTSAGCASGSFVVNHSRDMQSVDKENPVNPVHPLKENERLLGP